MLKNAIWLLSGLIILGFWACEEEVVKPEDGAPFAISPVKVPQVVDISRPKIYPVMFRVTHPQGSAAIDKVTLMLLASDGQTIFLQQQLYDDGGFVNAGSGDVVAGDGVYSILLQSSGAFPQGDFFITAEANDVAGNQVNSERLAARTILNVPPQIISVDMPDTLKSGSPPQTFATTVVDSNETDDIRYTLMALKRDNVLFGIDTLYTSQAISNVQALMTIVLDSTYAAERIGTYQLELVAVDASDERSAPQHHPIFLENFPPRLYNVVLPDTVNRPASGGVIVAVHITANDPQGLGDVQMVNMTVQRSGGPASVIEMFDDGDIDNNRDSVAGDGIYSRALVVENTSTPGTFYFTFDAQDRVGNTAAAVIDSMVIVP
jgi:hypothetical protein